MRTRRKDSAEHQYSRIVKHKVCPAFRRLRRHRIKCVEYSCGCCHACARNEMFRQFGTCRFIRIHKIQGSFRVMVVVGSLAVLPMLKFQLRKEDLAVHTTETNMYLLELCEFKKAKELWKKVRIYMRALWFSTWLKQLVAEREYHPDVLREANVFDTWRSEMCTNASNALHIRATYAFSKTVEDAAAALARGRKYQATQSRICNSKQLRRNPRRTNRCKKY